jgi:hypothetical protein
MKRWWPIFEPWPRNLRARRAIIIVVVVAGLAEVGTVIAGPSLTWLSAAVLIVLWAILVIAVIIERPKRRLPISDDRSSQGED